MEEIAKLTSTITEMQDKIETLSKKANRYEQKCFELIEKIEIKEKMLHDIEKIVFNKSKKKSNTNL
jgi:prefoldin subunit 5